MMTVSQFITDKINNDDNYAMIQFLIAKLSGHISHDEIDEFIDYNYEFFNEMYINAHDDYIFLNEESKILNDFVKSTSSIIDSVIANMDDSTTRELSLKNIIKQKQVLNTFLYHTDLESFLDTVNDDSETSLYDLWSLIVKHNLLNYDDDHILNLIEAFDPFENWDLDNFKNQFHSFLSNNTDEV